MNVTVHGKTYAVTTEAELIRLLSSVAALAALLSRKVA